MTALLILSLLLPARPVAGQSPAARADSGVAAQFPTFAEHWRVAYNAADSLALTGFYLPDARYISGHVSGLAAEGRERVVVNFLKGARLGGHIDRVAVLSADVSGDLAVLHCSYHATNAGQPAAGRNLLVLRRVNGRWLIGTHVTVVKEGG
jgi:ketosteroid isomerase-like protein